MAQFLLTVIDYGRIGIERAEAGDAREVAEALAHQEYEPTDPAGRGLLKVWEADEEAGTLTDITADICKRAEHYIAANNMSASDNIVRLLQDYKVIPDWVSAIEAGIWIEPAPSSLRAA